MGHKLFRIRAIRSFNGVNIGDLGGYIEKEANLSHDNDAWISDNACVYGNARIYNNARIYDNVCISGNACVYDDARIYNNVCISGNALIYNNACIYDDARICGDAWIHSETDYLCFKGLGSQNRNTTFFKCKDGHIHVSCGCFSGSIQEFETKVKKTHGDSKYAKEYLACIEVVKIHFEKE